MTRRLLAREPLAPSWRELLPFYRTAEARGEIRGGRFVTEFNNKQFTTANAVEHLHAMRKSAKIDELIVLSAVDPLNLVGILTPEDRVPAMHRNRVLYRDGLPIAALEGGQLRRLAHSEMSDDKLRTLLARRTLRHPLRPHLRTPTAREAALMAHQAPLGEGARAAALRARH
jgi:ATP-dependent Lhr-like helicase